MKIAFLYEHPTWSNQLIQCFRDNGLDITLINIAEHTYDTGQLKVDYDLLINRVNIMPSETRDLSVVFHTQHFLHWLTFADVKVINGAKAHVIGASKVLQNALFAKLGLDFPKAIALHKIEDAVNALDTIGVPMIVKPNIGGSGSYIAKYESKQALEEDIAKGNLKLGVDNTGLAQEYIESDGYVYRVEILGDDLFYSIRQKMISDQFNYCVADGCSISTEESGNEFGFCATENSAAVEVFDVSNDILKDVKNILRGAEADVGGVEFFVNTKTDAPCYYDFNPYSNFVSNGETLLGFYPEQRFVDFIKNRMLSE